MRAVDLFAGWGGFTQGASDVGIDVVWAANHWPVAVRTHELNHPDTTHACQDLRQTDWSALPEFEILLASPACQGHSRASQPRRRKYHDALRATAFAVVDCADVCEPAAIVVENVPSFLQWRLYDWWRGGLERLGYSIEVHLLTASRFGVPQRRTRMFLVATRAGASLGTLVQAAKEPAFAPCLAPAAPHSWAPVAQATPGVQRRIADGRVRHGTRFLTQHTSGHAGVALSEPIRTITTAPSHWNLVDGDQYRALSGRELARGMGFPDSYRWPAELGVADVTKGLGNAVCPPVAAAVLARLADVLS